MTDDEPATWLDAGYVQTVLGPDSVGANLDLTALEEDCVGTRSYVEGRRSDLFVLVDQADPDSGSVFVPTGSVRLGAAMLAYRFYQRRNTPLGVLGFSEDGATSIMSSDPDISKLLGIGKQGRFVFGGTAPTAVSVA